MLEAFQEVACYDLSNRLAKSGTTIAQSFIADSSTQTMIVRLDVKDRKDLPKTSS